MDKLPSISIITCTYNSDIHTFARVLKSLANQDYPKKLIEHIVMDGGSTNNCIGLAQKHGCKVIIHNDPLGEEQVRPALAILISKHDLILILESDNILTSELWLRQMVDPFIKEKNIFCTYSIHNSYAKQDSFMTRYCALFGSPEPTLYYLKKTEKMRMDKNTYDKGYVIKEKQGYFLVKFSKETLPTLGDNGHMTKADLLKRVIKDPTSYTHTDAFAQIFELGYNKVAVVKNSIIHVTKSSLFDQIKRRIQVKENFYDKKLGKRKYLVFNPSSSRDRKNLLIYILISLTFIVPFIESVNGYRKIRDIAWFLHPLFCILMVIGYGYSEILFIFRYIKNRIIYVL